MRLGKFTSRGQKAQPHCQQQLAKTDAGPLYRGKRLDLIVETGYLEVLNQSAPSACVLRHAKALADHSQSLNVGNRGSSEHYTEHSSTMASLPPVTSGRPLAIAIEQAGVARGKGGRERRANTTQKHFVTPPGNPLSNRGTPYPSAEDRPFNTWMDPLTTNQRAPTAEEHDIHH